MFDKIATSYDRINSVLSLGLHSHWRSRLIAYLPKKNNLQILDLATGTGDVPLLLSSDPRVEKIVGLDLSQKMIEQGREKIARQKRENKIVLFHGDAVTIGRKDASADVVTLAFGIRNFSHPETSLKNIHRVLRPGGRVLILEFSTPRNPLWKGIYFTWLRFPLPIIGRLLSRHPTAYSYLNQSIEEFPSGKDFTNMMEQAGFHSLQAKELSFGSVTLYCGEKR